MKESCRETDHPKPFTGRTIARPPDRPGPRRPGPADAGTPLALSPGMSEERNPMRAITLAASLFMAGSAFAGPDVVSYTPSHSSGRIATYTYINAHVLKVNPRAQTITFRSESRNAVLTVEGDALTGLGRLRAGDDVLLGYRMGTLSGRSVRIVNVIMPGESLRFASTTRGTVSSFPVMTPRVAMAPSTLDDSAHIVTVPS